MTGTGDTRDEMAEGETVFGATVARELRPVDTAIMAATALETGSQRHYMPEVRALRAFLRDAGAQYSTPRRDPRTNIVDQDAKRTYELPAPALAKMFELQEACRRAGAVCHLSERQATGADPRSGLYIDLDLEHHAANGVFGEEQYECLASHIGGLLSEMFVEPAPATGDSAGAADEFKIFFTARGAPVPMPAEPHAPANAATVYDDGVHILVPGAQLTRDEKQLFFRRILERGALEEAFEGLPLAMEPAKALDFASASSPALFFGSAKSGRPTAYELAAAYRVRSRRGRVTATALSVAELERPVAQGGCNLVAELALRQDAVAVRYEGDRPPLVRRRGLELLPHFRALLPEATEEAVGEEATEQSLSALAVHDPRAQFLHEILALLPPEKYVADYTNWRNVVFALAHTSKDYLALAEWFTRRCPEKTMEAGSSRPAKLRELWEVARAEVGGGTAARPLTIRSLEYWARTEAPERYREVKGRGYYNYLGEQVYGYRGRLGHNHVARLLHLMLGNKFIVDELPGGRAGTFVWFEFVFPDQVALPGQALKWRVETDPHVLSNYISDSIPLLYEQMLENIQERRDGVADDPRLTEEARKSKSRYYTDVAKQLNFSRDRLHDRGYKRSVIAEAVSRFRKPGFASTLDKLPDVLGVHDAVLQLAGPTRAASELITAYHEIPVTRFTPTRFIGWDPQAAKVRYLLGCVRTAIPEFDAREKILFHTCMGLSGHTEPLLLFLYGGGENGKTTIAFLTKMALGDYGKKLDMSLLTTPFPNADAANSALMVVKDCRYSYLDEAKEGQEIQSTNLKCLVNPGELTGRQLYGTQETFAVQHTPTAISNYALEVDAVDHGTWRRLMSYCFKVKFVDNPDPTNKFEAKKDPELFEKHARDPAYHAAWLSILNHYWERLNAEYGGRVSRVTSGTIKADTEKFRASRDVLHRFLTTQVVVSPTHGGTYSLEIVSQRFFEWHERAIGRSRLSPGTLQSRVENSVIHKYIRTMPNGELEVMGCRFLDPGDTRLDPDEYFLDAAKVPAPGQPDTADVGREGVPAEAPGGSNPFGLDGRPFVNAAKTTEATEAAEAAEAVEAAKATEAAEDAEDIPDMEDPTVDAGPIEPADDFVVVQAKETVDDVLDTFGGIYDSA